jgi:hypothetical protein
MDPRLVGLYDIEKTPGTATYEMVRERVPFLEHDEDFQPYIAACVELVLSGRLEGALGVAGGDKAGVVAISRWSNRRRQIQWEVPQPYPSRKS